MANDSKPAGWFSRRHQTNEEHLEAGFHHDTKGDRQMSAHNRLREREARTNEEQLQRLINRGAGHCKEARRLRLEIELSK